MRALIFCVCAFSVVFSSATFADVTWKYYDPVIDGSVNLSQVRVIFNPGVSGPPDWGDLEIAAGTVYPVWQKSETENIVLTTEPLAKQGPPGLPGDWSQINDNSGGQWFSKDGQTLFFSMARLIPVFPPVSVPYDNLFHWKRQMAIWRSNDGIQWEPGYFNTPSEIDGGGYQHYGMYVRSLEGGNLYESHVLGYNAVTQQVFLEIAHSRDGIYWQRFEGHPPFGANSPPGGFAFGYMSSPNRLTITSKNYEILLLTRCDNAPHFVSEVMYNNELSTLTAAWLQAKFEPRQLEKWPYWDEVFGSWQGFETYVADASNTVGILRYRKDGKVSLNSKAGSTGVLVTKVLQGAAEVSVNARTSATGEIKVEVLDANGIAFSDYSGQNAAYFSGDNVNHALTWKNGVLSNLPNEPFKLRIELVDAELYALNWQ